MRKGILAAFVFFGGLFSLAAACAQWDPALAPVNEETLQETEQQNEARRTLERIRYDSIIPAPDNPVYGVNPHKTIGEKIADGTFALNDIPHLVIYWIIWDLDLPP